MRRSLILLTAGALALTGCSSSDDALCSPDAQKRDVLDIARSWYLYPELLPTQVDLTQYEGPADLLAALTAGAGNRDRGWSYVTTLAATQSFYDEGTSVGFGFGILIRDSRLFVSQVFPGSAAFDAGFARGDEILAIGEPPAALAPVDVLISAGELGAALGPSEPGITRAFEVIPVGTTTSQLRAPTKRTFLLDPVPEWRTFPGSGGRIFGYVSLRTFIGPADTRLVEAFQHFQASGVTDVVVDLRYNGGGLLSTAQLLLDLLGGGLGGEIMYSVRNNPAHASQDGSAPFAPSSDSISPLSVAFITTGASASASELVPNSLEPSTSVALVGERTYGKPVGQRGFIVEGCDTVVYLVSFRLVNAEEEGDYFDGLPDTGGAFSGPLCDAMDDLSRDQHDPLEASTLAALHFLETGSCPAPAIPPALAPAAAAAADTHPEPARPTFAQRHVRGLF